MTFDRWDFLRASLAGLFERSVPHTVCVGTLTARTEIIRCPSKTEIQQQIATQLVSTNCISSELTICLNKRNIL